MATSFCIFGPTQISMLTGAAAWGRANPLMLAVVGLGVREASAVEAVATLGSMSSTAHAVDGFRLVYAWQRDVSPDSQRSVDTLLGKLLAFASADAVMKSVRGLPRYGEFSEDFEAKITAAAGTRAADVLIDGFSVAVRSGGRVRLGDGLVATRHVPISDDRAPIMSESPLLKSGDHGAPGRLTPARGQMLVPVGEASASQVTMWDLMVEGYLTRKPRG